MLQYSTKRCTSIQHQLKIQLTIWEMYNSAILNTLNLAKKKEKKRSCYTFWIQMLDQVDVHVHRTSDLSFRLGSLFPIPIISSLA